MVDLKISGIHTSNIGSFLLDDSAANRRRCTEDLLGVAIDFPAYPQLFDMGRQFLDDIAKYDGNLTLERDRYKLKGEEIERDVPPPGLEPFFWTLRYLEERGIKDKVKLKASITGPFTLASYIETRTGLFPFNTAVSNPDLVEQLADILSRSCEAVSNDSSMISIDEPVLGVIVGARAAFGYRDEEVTQIYNKLRKACKEKFVGTHICGRISPRLAEILLRTELDFLSHEFHDTPRNIEVYTPTKLEESGKVLSVGCVSSKNPRLESSNEILGVIEKFRNFGEDLIFTPDCGFRPLIVNGSKEKGYEVSVRKLGNMVEAVRRFKARK